MGRTHLQDGVPIRLGQEFEAYSRVLERDIKRIKQTRDHLYEVNMGATAVGTGLNADPRYIKRVVELLAELSGVPLINAEPSGGRNAKYGCLYRSVGCIEGLHDQHVQDCQRLTIARFRTARWVRGADICLRASPVLPSCRAR